MDAIDTLMSEHRTIQRVLDALVGFTEDARRRGGTEKEELARFVAFFRSYADAAHHAKEEEVLFQAMVANGFPRHGGPVAVMLSEHVHGRDLVGLLDARATQPEPWDEEQRVEIADAAGAFSSMLHAHIHKEDAILYPMAEQRLPPTVLDEVTAACARLDEARASSGELDRLQALADELVARHAPAVHPPCDSAPAARFGCGG